MATVTDFAAYADKEPTSLHKALAAWIEKQTGVKVSAKAVSLTLTLHSTYQSSAENKKRRADEQAARAKTLKEKASAPKKAPAAKKATAVAPKKAAAKKPAAKKAAAKKPATKPQGAAAF